MKMHRNLPCAIGLGFAWFAGGLAMAESLPSLTEKAGQRPKFTSKIHLPVQLAAEVTALPPAGYKLVFADEVNGDTLDAQKWGHRLDSKMLSTRSIATRRRLCALGRSDAPCRPRRQIPRPSGNPRI